MNQFIAFRTLQGLGDGIGIALAFVLVADMDRGEDSRHPEEGVNCQSCGEPIWPPPANHS